MAAALVGSLSAVPRRFGRPQKRTCGLHSVDSSVLPALGSIELRARHLVLALAHCGASCGGAAVALTRNVLLEPLLGVGCVRRLSRLFRSEELVIKSVLGA